MNLTKLWYTKKYLFEYEYPTGHDPKWATYEIINSLDFNLAESYNVKYFIRTINNKDTAFIRYSENERYTVYSNSIVEIFNH